MQVHAAPVPVMLDVVALIALYGAAKAKPSVALVVPDNEMVPSVTHPPVPLVTSMVTVTLTEPVPDTVASTD